ncbi:MAG: hypothetical protein JST96_18570, partial [Bacteroidetes bacterium]|nr:hypothetical protein [Bacteroidota bacterium]
MKHTSCFLLVVFFCFHLIASPVDTTRYTILTSGTVSGKQLSWKNNKNSYGYYYEDNDRGRGPSITQTVVTNDNGVVIKEEITGVDYFKTAVKEIFSVKQNKAFWKNKFEDDSAVFKNQVYSEINGTPAAIELLLKMLRSSPAKQLDVLPAGTRNFSETTEKEISNGKEKITVQLVAFSGYGGAPSYTWFTKDGKFFASVSEWSSIIKQGFEKNADELYAVQKKYEQKFFTDLSKKITQKNPDGIAIKNANVFDVKTGTVRSNYTVLIKEGRIERVGDVASINIPSSYKIINGTNKFLMPGLWEMHGHFFQEAGPFMLAQGVTNLRDMGNGPGLLTLRD